MSAVLTNNMGNIDKITFFMDECKRMGIAVKGPDINESDVNFAVNKNKEIRYALSAIKGVGEAAVQSIIDERKNNGPYKSIFDLTRRAIMRSVNKKSLEALALAGAFDCFTNIFRAQYFMPDKRDGMSVLEKAIKYGNNIQNAGNSQQNSLFGGTGGGADLTEPTISAGEEWSLLEKLKKEKEVTGVYISGHPLDDYRLEIQTFTNCKLNEVDKKKDKEVKVAGIVTTTETKIAKNGNPYCRFTMEDFDGTYSFSVFGKDYLAFKTFIETNGALLYIAGKYQPRWDGKEYEFKILRIDLLSDVRTKLTKYLSLEFNVFEVNDKMIDDIQTLIAKYPGNTKLRIKFLDLEEGIKIGLSTISKAVDLNNELLKELDGLHVGYSLN
jgi:DNA polymerase-3 subunit alpha